MNPIVRRVRTPVRRQGADTFLLITLLSFAASVAVTRLFLTLTGYPQIGGGGIHIAHVLWGGLLLFVAALLPLIYANRGVYAVDAVLAGAGIGLFIDEVGKFITQANDYFYPGAAPIIYAFFLLTVLLYLQIRRPPSLDPRAELYRALEGLEEVLDRDLEAHEQAELETHLNAVIQRSRQPELSRMASELQDFLASASVIAVLAPPCLPIAVRSVSKPIRPRNAHRGHNEDRKRNPRMPISSAAAPAARLPLAELNFRSFSRNSASILATSASSRPISPAICSLSIGTSWDRL
jgi:hypothetical protein